ncbi:hypothetical protein ES705_48670 [subsurface metagenome]
MAAVCSETELAAAIATHAGLPTVHQDAPALIAARVPSGLIILWHGTIANIPSGWVICDGNNSTPNLLTRFIEGVATAATNPGATGGATSKSHASHTHTMPTHTHTIVTEAMKEGDGPLYYVTDDATMETGATDPGDTNSKTVTAHSDIRPKYYDVAFLMKT